jgi:hypothetical protein
VKTFTDPDLIYQKLKEQQLSEEWFTKCKAEMKPHKNARLALKMLHQAGTSRKNVRRIIPDISSAIDKISTDKGDQRSDWKNSLWCFVSQFSELDSLELVKIYEQLNSKKQSSSVKNSKKDADKKEKRKDSLTKHDQSGDQALRKEKREQHREKLKRKYEQGEKEPKERKKYEKHDKYEKLDENRKRKFHQRKYNDNSYDKFRRTDPPAAPSMF